MELAYLISGFLLGAWAGGVSVGWVLWIKLKKSFAPAQVPSPPLAPPERDNEGHLQVTDKHEKALFRDGHIVDVHGDRWELM